MAKKEKTQKNAKVKKSSGGLGKYIGLITYILLFLILTVGMLGLSAYNTRQSADKSKILAISSEMEIITQRISKNILDVNIYLSAELRKTPDRDWVAISALPQESQYRMDELKDYRDILDQNINAFYEGGKGKSLFSEESIDIEKMDKDYVAYENLQSVYDIWQLYKGLIDGLLVDAEQLGILYTESADFLVDYERNYIDPILFNMNKITAAFTRDISYEAKYFENIQLGGIAAALLLFLFIVFGALRQLLRNDALLAIANREMNEIMSSVNEGLFLVDRDLVIGNEYSARLEEIIGEKEIAGRTLVELLKDIVTEEELDTTKTFIDQLYSEWVVEDLIDDLNPLNRICIKGEGLGDKYLDFKFFRVIHNNKIERVLVNVTDTTEIVMLQESQKMQKEQEGQELEMLNIILNTNPAVLSSFIRDSQNKLNEINRSLKSQSTTQRELKDKVVYIARLIHSIKGEASSIKLVRMVAICETFEESLGTMKNAHILRGQDFLALVVWLEDLFRLFDILDGYNRRLNNPGAGPIISNDLIQKETQSAYFTKFIQDVAQRTDKKVNLEVKGFDEIRLSENMQTKLRGIAIQLLRNSMVHGIESPEVRRQRNKNEVGQLKLKLNRDEAGQVTLEVEDDGNGINFNAIRAKAIKNGFSPDEVQAMNQQQLYNLMFSSGFSTAEQQTEDAGRGVGMDIIKASVKEMGGRINISTHPAAFTRFKFIFPKEV